MHTQREKYSRLRDGLRTDGFMVWMVSDHNRIGRMFEIIFQLFSANFCLILDGFFSWQIYLLKLWCFSPQRRAIFPDRNFKKWSEPVSFLTFWLWNVLLATEACNFSTSQLQKVIRPWGVLYILTLKCSPRYSGVQFFHIATSKSGPSMQCFVHFDFKMCFSLQRSAIFHFSAQQLPPHPPRYTEVTFRPRPPTNHWKIQHFVTSLTFRACGSSFYWFSRNCIFFLLNLLFFSAFSSSDSATLLCFFNCPYCRKLDF